MATITLRKKAPFFCRTQAHGGKPACLKPLKETDGKHCEECVAEFDAIKADQNSREAHKSAARESLFRERQTREDEEWQSRLAKGPIWP